MRVSVGSGGARAPSSPQDRGEPASAGRAARFRRDGWLGSTQVGVGEWLGVAQSSLDPRYHGAVEDSGDKADAGLIAAARAGDAEARSALATRLGPVVDRYLQARAGAGVRRHLSTADLRQDVLVALDELLTHLRPGAGWRDLEALAIQRTRWNLHKAARRPRVEQNPSVVAGPDGASPEAAAPRPTEGAVTRADRVAVLGRLVDELPEDRRDIVRRRLAGETFEEIGSALDLAEATVRYRFVAALKGLRSVAGEDF